MGTRCARRGVFLDGDAGVCSVPVLEGWSVGVSGSFLFLICSLLFFDSFFLLLWRLCLFATVQLVRIFFLLLMPHGAALCQMPRPYHPVVCLT